jgi:prefoldin subunit 5
MATATKALRKENEALKEEIQQIMTKLQHLEQKFDMKKEADGMAAHKGKAVSSDRAKSIEFISNEYDELAGFKTHAMKELKSINARVDQISTRCNDIAKCVEVMEEYSYQFNVKIVGMPLKAEKKSPETTANLCLQLFSALGVKYVSLQDIDIAHRVPARQASSRPNAIICKFVRRLAKNKVMETRKEVSKLQAVQLGFSSGTPVEHEAFYTSEI